MLSKYCDEMKLFVTPLTLREKILVQVLFTHNIWFILVSVVEVNKHEGQDRLGEKMIDKKLEKRGLTDPPKKI